VRSEKAALATAIKQIAEQLGLHKDLGIESSQYSEADIQRLGDYAEELADEKITDTPYIMGVPYTQEDIRTTVYAMTTDPIAYSLYALDRQQGKAPAGLEARKASFNARYLKKATALVDRYYASGSPISPAELQAVTGLTAAQISRADSITEALSAPKGMMAMMMAASRKKDGKKDSTGAAGGMARMMKMKSDTTAIPAPKRSPMAKVMQWNMRKMLAKRRPRPMPGRRAWPWPRAPSPTTSSATRAATRAK